ncbi:bifunctional non-homologous end joining protein LigD [Halobacillus karajensis]|uniref:DNA ligase D n=1 Tax=Halobacillus karajensis TaxID=195088 RepID=UPI0008A72C75|nr:DNA ligase D [Halobacillus karajensis]SEH49200.1 bifunctional non-homologous end joining protein LigD [Halobacillus karajensis]
MRPMLLTPTSDLPSGNEWLYEIKYDGFRAIMEASEEGIKLWSRNGKDLSARFPEIAEIRPPKESLPFTLDGEIVILKTPYQADFEALQIRGRMRKREKIMAASKERPASFIAFDSLDNPSLPLTKRKERLKKQLNKINHTHIQAVEVFEKKDKAEAVAELHLAEGIVAKMKKSPYRSGERGQQWLKWKQWRTIAGFLQTFNSSNGYYEAGYLDGQDPRPLGKFKHGLSEEESETLRAFFKEHGTKKKDSWHLEAGTCVDIHCLSAEQGELREPMFHQFRFDLTPEECTGEKLQWDLSLFPEAFESSHIDKFLWPGVTKQEFLIYIRHMAPYLLPFIQEKKLTLIRYPDGIHEESFYQKHSPDHAPDFLKMWMEDGNPYIICDHLLSLLWLANQGALEYHVPFEKAGGEKPDEIVLDLDPMDKEHFKKAITAAQLLKPMLDELDVISFIKTSGNKGMQIHIPIQEGDLNYEETRKITETLATLLVNEEPELFTTERLKKNRGDRLYIDYVQHAEGKTIIAPYSPRATEKATIATPLFWEEVVEGLDPASFTIHSVPIRLKENGCPFSRYEEARAHQPIRRLKRLLE